MLAHIHIMKTAGQTLCDVLRQSFPGRHCDMQAQVATPSDLRIARRFYPNLSSISGHCVLPLNGLQTECPEIRFFTIVRDPVQRCVSHYQFVRQKRRTDEPFSTWLPKHANFQVRSLCRTLDMVDPSEITAEQAIATLEQHVGFVGMLERYHESLVMLRKWCEPLTLDITHRSRNIAVDNSIKKELLADPQVVAQIKSLHQEDQKLYHYVRDVIYPRQLLNYGHTLSADLKAFEESLPGGQRRIIGRSLASAKRNLLYKPFTRFCLGRRAGRLPESRAA